MRRQGQAELLGRAFRQPSWKPFGYIRASRVSRPTLRLKNFVFFMLGPVAEGASMALPLLVRPIDSNVGSHIDR